jgi:hypothetical protein
MKTTKDKEEYRRASTVKQKDGRRSTLQNNSQKC